MEYLKSGHSYGLDRLQSYIKMLVRRGMKDEMAELNRLHAIHNSNPCCIHEKTLRDAVAAGMRDLGLEPKE